MKGQTLLKKLVKKTGQNMASYAVRVGLLFYSPDWKTVYVYFSNNYLKVCMYLF